MRNGALTLFPVGAWAPLQVKLKIFQWKWNRGRSNGLRHYMFASKTNDFSSIKMLTLVSRGALYKTAITMLADISDLFVYLIFLRLLYSSVFFLLFEFIHNENIIHQFFTTVNDKNNLNCHIYLISVMSLFSECFLCTVKIFINYPRWILFCS